MKPLSPGAERAMYMLIPIGLLLIVAGTLMPLLTAMNCGPWFKYVYTVGAVVLTIGRLFTPSHGENLRVKRLHRLESWSGIFFCVAAFFLFYDRTSMRDWLAFTIAAGCIQAYASFMIPRAMIKAAKETKLTKKS